MIEDGNEETKDNHEQQQQQKEESSDVGTINNPSPLRSEQGRFEASLLPRRSGRQTQLPARYKDYALMTNILNVVETVNYNEESRFDEWRSAMKEEYESTIRNRTWDLVKLPEGKQPIGCKWLYKPKFKVDGIIDKYKSRLVAKGYL